MTGSISRIGRTGAAAALLVVAFAVVAALTGLPSCNGKLPPPPAPAHLAPTVVNPHVEPVTKLRPMQTSLPQPAVVLASPPVVQPIEDLEQLAPLKQQLAEMQRQVNSHREQAQRSGDQIRELQEKVSLGEDQLRTLGERQEALAARGRAAEEARRVRANLYEQAGLALVQANQTLMTGTPEVGALLSAAREGRITCEDLWRVSAEPGVSKLDVGGAAEALKLKVIRCQLGCF